MKWVEQQCNDIGKVGNLSLMYGIDGRKDLFEIELTHLEGYKKSYPVRIGNGAYDQIQLDIYGELLDSVYLFDKHGEPISYDFWLDVSQQVNWVCDHWQQADQGIWEVRGGKKEFLYSRMMCWVACHTCWNNSVRCRAERCGIKRAVSARGARAAKC